MTTRCKAITDCKEGDILVESVSNRFGAAIVVENTVLNGYIIEKVLGKPWEVK